MLSVTKAIPFQSGIFADVWRVTQERYYQVKKVCRSALINPALICVGRMARGYVSPDLWEEGINAGLLNYSFNGNSINNRSNHNAGKSNYAYLNLQSGINIGSWRLRDNSTWSYNSGSSNSSDSNKWQHINTSAERDIIPLRSRLQLFQ